MKTDATVTIIGLGNIGEALAKDLSKSKRKFFIADRDITKANSLAETLGDHATATDIKSAIENSNIIIPAIPFEALSSFFSEYSNRLSGKTIIDVSNPIAPDADGGFKKIIASSDSAGQVNAKLIPAGANLVKALGTLGAGSLLEVAHQAEKATLFYALDDTSLSHDIKGLIQDLGFDAVSVGDISQSIRIEVFGDLHEFGSLGKPVTKAVALSKI